MGNTEEGNKSGCRIVKSDDGSYTAYNALFDEHYHSTKDGALNESLYKHVIPAFATQQHKETITILDICFGLGFNTLATLYYLRKNGFEKKIRIFSPEFDGDLVASLDSFPYPEAFTPFAAIVETLSREKKYSDEKFTIELYIGDAREYLRQCNERFDIVYQDAFSPSANPLLWTKEYFDDIARVIKDDGVLTTYSMALSTRLALYDNGFNIYLNRGESYRNATVASKNVLSGFEPVNMAHKIACNPLSQPLHDKDF